MSNMPKSPVDTVNRVTTSDQCECDVFSHSCGDILCLQRAWRMRGVREMCFSHSCGDNSPFETSEKNACSVSYLGRANLARLPSGPQGITSPWEGLGVSVSAGVAGAWGAMGAIEGDE